MDKELLNEINTVYYHLKMKQVEINRALFYTKISFILI